MESKRVLRCILLITLTCGVCGSDNNESEKREGQNEDSEVVNNTGMSDSEMGVLQANDTGSKYMQAYPGNPNQNDKKDSLYPYRQTSSGSLKSVYPNHPAQYSHQHTSTKYLYSATPNHQIQSDSLYSFRPSSPKASKSSNPDRQGQLHGLYSYHQKSPESSLSSRISSTALYPSQYYMKTEHPSSLSNSHYSPPKSYLPQISPMENALTPQTTSSYYSSPSIGESHYSSPSTSDTSHNSVNYYKNPQTNTDAVNVDTISSHYETHHNNQEYSTSYMPEGDTLPSLVESYYDTKSPSISSSYMYPHRDGALYPLHPTKKFPLPPMFHENQYAFVQRKRPQKSDVSSGSPFYSYIVPLVLVGLSLPAIGMAYTYMGKRKRRDLNRLTAPRLSENLDQIYEMVLKSLEKHENSYKTNVA